ncbi:GlcG/HbpS family heme-binding protein [Paraburkholderia megapolitana]|uniref:GlcG/HbpS family heme-binding protein n=1 Tax=Paraburkholderia megapolitana TaxID=420953 RepID=UPI0038B6BEFA
MLMKELSLPRETIEAHTDTQAVSGMRSGETLSSKMRSVIGSTVAALVGIAVAMSAAAAGTDPLSVGPLPVEVAIKAAQNALTACDRDGYHVTVSIVDREGITRVFLVGDGAGPISISTSRRKAYTSAALGVSTGDMAKHAAASGHPPPAIDPEILALGGGLPIVSRDVVVGGIGVGGADVSEKDEACARAGLDSIKDQLK